MATVGIIGNGVVGGAWGKALERKGDKVLYYDSRPERSKAPLSSLLGADWVFVCIPTPECGGARMLSTSDDWVDLKEIVSWASNGNRRRPDDSLATRVVIRSTLLPGITSALQEMYPSVPLIYLPEFLTERTAEKDAMDPGKFVLGYTPQSLEYGPELFDFLRERFSGVSVQPMRAELAEWVKILTNAFYAAKVSLFNEFASLVEGRCTRGAKDWETVRRAMVTSSMVEETHTHVPGPDGQRGFGGKCLPKDLRALIEFVGDLNVPLLAAVENRNLMTDRRGG